MPAVTWLSLIVGVCGLDLAPTLLPVARTGDNNSDGVRCSCTANATVSREEDAAGGCELPVFRTVSLNSCRISEKFLD